MNNEKEKPREDYPRKTKKNQKKMDICLELYYTVKISVDEMAVPLFDNRDFGACSFFHLFNVN